MIFPPKVSAPIVLRIVILLCLSGCLRTKISPEAALPETTRLAAVNSTRLSFELSAEGVSGTVGHQYLLLLIPFGAIELEPPMAELENAVFESLAMRGYKPIQKNQAQLHIAVRTVQLSAYDFLVVRKMLCQLELTGVLTKAGRRIREETVRVSPSSYQRFAFTPELTKFYSSCARTAAGELFDRMGL